jgi:hypothetical protein
MTMQSFLGGILSGALTTDETTWDSPSFPNGLSRKASIIIQNDASSTRLDLIGRQGGALTNEMTTTIYCVVTAFQIAGTSKPDGAEFQLKGVWYRDLGSLTVIKAPTVVDSNPNAHGAAWTAVLATTSGQGVQILVTGDAAKTIRWSSVTTMYEG